MTVDSLNNEGVRIDVWSDYACPWCFLAATSLEKLEESHAPVIQRRAYELRPQGAPPMSEEYRARIEEAQPRLQAIAREQYGLELNSGPFGINTRPALIAAKLAEWAGRGREFHAAVFRAYWLDGKDISDPAVLGDVAEGVGLEREPFVTALDDAAADAAVQEDIDLARELGLNSVPAMVYDEKYLVSGAQPYAVLAQLTEQVAGMNRGDPA